MAKPPSVNWAQLGAVMDALTTTNALLFTVIASRKEHDAALALLRRALQGAEDDGLDDLRRHVMEQTVTSLQELRQMREASPPDAGQGRAQ